MADLAPKPDWAPAIWTDSRGFIYLQFGQDVLRFEPTEVHKWIKLIPKVEAQLGFLSGGQNIADHVLKKPIKVTKTTEKKRMLRQRSPERAAKYRELIAKSGIKESK